MVDRRSARRPVLLMASTADSQHPGLVGTAQGCRRSVESPGPPHSGPGASARTRVMSSGDLLGELLAAVGLMRSPMTTERIVGADQTVMVADDSTVLMMGGAPARLAAARAEVARRAPWPCAPRPGPGAVRPGRRSRRNASSSGTASEEYPRLPEWRAPLIISTQIRVPSDRLSGPLPASRMRGRAAPGPPCPRSVEQ